MKKIAIILAAFALTGCYKNGYSTVKFPETPQELSDCKFFNMSNDKGTHITVARCPNSTTTTNFRSGKVNRSVVIIDGVEYEKKELGVENPQDLIPK